MISCKKWSFEAIKSLLFYVKVSHSWAVILEDFVNFPFLNQLNLIGLLNLEFLDPLT